MRLLLDSHVVIWWLQNPAELTARARAAIADPANEAYVSAASIWEIGLKAAKSKLLIAAEFPSLLRSDGFVDLPIHARHAERTLALPPHHGDPFDRMLIAQALEENLTLVSRDRWIPAYGVPHLVA
jgi:PIN domain nuclease of toxin-antitoxin system